MDPITLATAAVAALAPYLGKAAERFATAAGDTAFRKAGELYGALKQRLIGHPVAAAALEDLERTPADTDAQAQLRMQLKKLIADDAAFASELATLTAAATTLSRASFHNEIQGPVGNIIQPGGDIHTLNIGGEKK